MHPGPRDDERQMSNIEQTEEAKAPVIVEYQEDSYINFVKWLISRTEDGDLKWDLQPNLVSARLRAMVTQFATSKCTDHLHYWNVFTVRGEKAELIRVSSLSCGNLPLKFAVRRLFSAIVKPAELSRAWGSCS